MKTEGRKPVIGLALGSGAARGWAHIGVIETLADMGIRPQVVAGTSIGAFVGAAYAAGQLKPLKSWVKTLSWKDILTFLDVTLGDAGLIQGDKLFDFVRQHMPDGRIENLPTPFAAVATDLYSGQEVWFREGPLLQAVRASIALPGLFTPIEHEGRWLVDGGLVDPVPISLCRAMGADVVIAVNLNGGLVGRHFQIKSSSRDRTEPGTGSWAAWSQRIRESLNGKSAQWLGSLLGKDRKEPGLFDVMAGSINIMQDRITRSRMAGDPPEVHIAPRLAHLGIMEFDRADEAMAEGRAATQRMKGHLELCLNRGIR